METASNDYQPIKVFYSYSRQDKRLRDQLAKHLTLLKQQGFITDWNEQDIKPGQEWKKEINKNLQEADIILLLVSASFIESKYCDSPEVDVALQKHEAQEAWVIPILLRSVNWETSSIGKLQALPYNLKPIDLWSNRESAFAVVTRDIRSVVMDLHTTKNKHKGESELAIVNPTPIRPVRRKKRDLYKTLAKANNFTIGQKIQHKSRIIGRYFSFNAANRRSKKRFSLLLLFLFGVLNLIVIPFIISQWTKNLLIVSGTFISSFLLFTMGTLSKNNIVSALITFIYCIGYIIIAYWYIGKIYYLHFSFFSIVLISVILSCFQLSLFYTPSPKKRRLPFFPKDPVS